MSARDLVVAPLVTRHAEDAAFYWSQADGAGTAFALTPARLAHFDRLLEAHLEGLAVAGAEGLEPALVALERWRKSGEAFVCTWLVAQHPGDSNLANLSQRLAAAPDTLLRGAISALARLPAERSAPLRARWLAPEAAPHEQVVALRAEALIDGTTPPDETFFNAADAHVRAAACRACATAPESSIAALSARLHDEALPVRAEAAIALRGTASATEALAVLWQCVATQATLSRALGGADARSAARRLHRWVRHLAWAAPFGHPDLPALFEFLPPRQALTFALYHGDCAHLPRVIAAMDDAQTARYAGWVWQALTGVDLAANGLLRPDPPLDTDAPVDENRRDADNGLPLPDPAAIAAYRLALPTGTRLLLGQPLTPELAIDVLDEAVQAFRVIAAHALTMYFPDRPMHARAPYAHQRRALNALATAIAR